ncbi:MAG: Haloacid dehalogenase domain protein hydrolase [Thermoleophilia bacterium]|nr:Haloacid dehalogenase domain protein hydrolase [Thermoleophilia bacterium]
MTGVEAVLCDADGNLFPSEQPAFSASAAVVNRFCAAIGFERTFTGEYLRSVATGRNFRSIAAELASIAQRQPEAGMEHWIAEEQRVVTAHLAETLRPDPDVRQALEALAHRAPLALVSSSASVRLDACLEATGLADLFPPERRYSAEDSLSHPASKPDPAIYVHATEQMGVSPAGSLAVEDSVVGVRSAVAAGVPVAGNLAFVPADERPRRAAELRDAGAALIVERWDELITA